MTSPEPTEAPVRRPRARRASEAVASSNGTHPKVDPRLSALTLALEDLRIAVRDLELPPVRVAWQEEDPDLDARPDPERRALQEHVESFLADYEGARLGPLTQPISEIAEPPDVDDYLVTNLIRPGTTVMLAGPPGAAKSWASRQLALSCAAGLPTFLGHYEITRPMRVLVVDEDNGPKEEYRREESLMAHLELERPAMGAYRRVTLEGIKLDTEAGQRWLRGQIRTHDLDLVLLDPTSEFHEGKELREDPSFRSLLAFLKRLKVDFPRLATLLVHHTRKLQSSDRSSARGLEDVRGQWGQTPDVVVLLSPLPDRRSKWEVHKRVPHSSLLLEQIARGEAGEGALRFVADETVVRSKAMANDGAVIDAIRGGLTTNAEIVEGIGMRRSTVSDVLARLLRAGVIEKDGRGYRVREED